METHMKSVLYGIAALPLLTGVAFATEPVTKQPMQLTAHQMDKVTAGFSFYELTPSNTSLTELSIYGPALTPCGSCYLHIESSSISVQSQMGPGAFLPPAP